MINTQKAILVYNKSTNFNLNGLNTTVKSKIEKISRVDPTTGNAFQVWAPNTSPAVINFSALTCGNIYIIESVNTATFPYQLTNDGSDDGLRSANDYDKNICSGGVTPTPTATPSLTITPTPTPTNTPTLTPTPTPTLPQVLWIAYDQFDGGLWGAASGATPNDVAGSFAAYCYGAMFSYTRRNGTSVADKSIGNLVVIKNLADGVTIGVASFENQYYATTQGGNDGVSVTYRCNCSVYTGKVNTTKTTDTGILYLTLITDQCTPTPTPTPTKTPTPTPTTNNNLLLTAVNPNLELGGECIPSVQCPSGALGTPYCCGEASNKIEYIVTSGLVKYQTTGMNSILSIANIATGDQISTPQISVLKVAGNYYGQIIMNTTRYNSASFQITDGCTRYSGVIQAGDINMSSQTIC